MNSFSLGFFYICGMAWCLAECCIWAVAGNPVPAILYLVAFVLIFAILGCLKVSDRVVNLTGAVTAVGLAASLFYFSVQTGGFVGVVKIIVSLAFVLGAVASLLYSKEYGAERGHSPPGKPNG